MMMIYTVLLYGLECVRCNDSDSTLLDFTVKERLHRNWRRVGSSVQFSSVYFSRCGGDVNATYLRRLSDSHRHFASRPTTERPRRKCRTGKCGTGERSMNDLYIVLRESDVS